MGDVIHLHPKHGMNPGMECCFYCNEPKGVILWGQLKPSVREHLAKAGIDTPDGEAPRNIVLNMEPCDKCKGFMEQGVIVISVRDTDDPEEQRNPYRTGGWCVVKDDFFKGLLHGPFLESILKGRFAFIPDPIWKRLGLPRGEVKHVDDAGA